MGWSRSAPRVERGLPCGELRPRCDDVAHEVLHHVPPDIAERAEVGQRRNHDVIGEAADFRDELRILHAIILARGHRFAID